MRRVVGWLTNDNQFYEQAERAVLHEAETEMLNTFSNSMVITVPATMVVTWIDQYADTIRSYVNAREAVNQLPKAHDDQVDHVDDGSAEEGNEDIHEQSPNRFGDVSDVGSDTPAEEVQDGREGYGIGSGERNARGFRVDPALASQVHPQVTTTRRGERDTPVRERPLDRNQQGGQVKRPA